ncbi:unnamed protein product [Fraxinus pennsylvanica]|uniref:C2H2-type domain-containing protein n=1 Tax=Fraxinus pennsylvanica TaxID=56036 RepID=A0AAD2ECS3_9LAMI|nr:unnamed protein product [Fraxinus pennsylvanica]
MNDRLKLERHSSISVQLSYPRASTSYDGKNVTHHVKERVYGCKYCHKKFSSKQALGGHQNGHKVERVIERNANFGRVGGPSYRGMNSLPFQSSFHIGREIFNQSTRNRSCNPRNMQHGMLANGYPNSNLSITQEPHAHEPLQEFSHGYPIWPNPHLTDSQFMAASTGMENHTLNFSNSTFRTACSHATTISGVSGGISTANYLQSIHDTNLRAEIYHQITDSTNQQCPYSELDLSLKL